MPSQSLTHQLYSSTEEKYFFKVFSLLFDLFRSLLLLSVALEKMDAMLSSPTRWSCQYQEVTDVDDFKLSECGEAFMTLISTLTGQLLFTSCLVYSHSSLSIWAIRLREKMAPLYCVVYDICALWYPHDCEYFRFMCTFRFCFFFSIFCLGLACILCVLC